MSSSKLIIELQSYKVFLPHLEISLWFSIFNKEIQQISFTKLPHSQSDFQSDLALKAATQFIEYDRGIRKHFDLPTSSFSGSALRKKTMCQLLKIPYAKTLSYFQLAQLSGCPRGARAIGSYMNKNQLPLIYPCHRIISSSGKLGGFAVDLDIKKKLLLHEKKTLYLTQYRSL